MATSITLFTRAFSSRSKKSSAVVLVNPMVATVTAAMRLFRGDRTLRVGSKLYESHLARAIPVGRGQPVFPWGE